MERSGVVGLPLNLGRPNVRPKISRCLHWSSLLDTKRGNKEREGEDLKLKQAGENWQMAHQSKGDGDRYFILLKGYLATVLAIELTKWFAIGRVQPSAGVCHPAFGPA